MIRIPLGRAVAVAVAVVVWAATIAADAGRVSTTSGSSEFVQTAPDTWSAVDGERQLRAGFSDGGVRVEPVGPASAGWTLKLSLRRYGTPSDQRDVSPAWPLGAGDRLQIARRDLDEWLVSGTRGFEYGVRLTEGAGRGLDVLEYVVGRGVTPKIREDGREVGFFGSSGEAVLILRDLRAIDAAGRDVDLAWATGAGTPNGAMRLLVQGFEHAYPIVVSAHFAAAKAPDPAAEIESAPPTAPLAVPANDQCGGAELIPSAGPFPYATATYDVTDATAAGDPPLPSCQTDVSRSIWFKFTPAATGNFTFALCGDAPTLTTLPDTVLSVYASTSSCAGLNQLSSGCDDDSCVSGGQQSVISAIGLTAGTTYYVVAWQFGTAPPSPGSASIQLLVSQNSSAGAPPNDQCGGAEVIPAAGPFPYVSSLTADITGAGVSGDPPAPSCQPDVSRSVWYAFTPAATGNYSFSSCADAPTGTTVDDTVLAVYAASGVCSGLAELAGGCDDDSCGVEGAQAVVTGLPLTAGQTYYVVAWKFGSAAPSLGNTAVQIRVDKGNGPPNDFCSGAVPLVLDIPLAGTTVNAADDYELTGSACFSGIGQTATTVPGFDATYKFTAPTAGSYSFRVNGFDPTTNAALYVASDCPGGSSPATVAGCLAASNRNSGNPAEEVTCLPLAAGQLVYIYVDEAIASEGTGSAFSVEVNACARESEPNDSPSTAGDLACGLEGAISPNGDADFFALGIPSAGSRVFAVGDGVAGNSTDFDFRVTTTTDTLEFDDANNDTAFGSLSPNLAGTPLGNAASYVKVNHLSAIQQSEPYRLYAVVQPSSVNATAEVEPNGTTGTATTGSNLYFSGALSATGDLDVFRFTPAAGDLVSLNLDLDPTRDNTPFNGVLSLLDAGGAVLLSVNDAGSTSNTTSGAGSLTIKTPNSPGEALTYRIRTAGAYYARVSYSSGTPGDYLLSIARNCRISPSTDVSVTQTDAPDPVALGGNVTYTVVVHNLGASPASVVQLRDDLPPGSVFVSATPSQGSCTGSGPVTCHLGTLAAATNATISIVVTAPGTGGSMANTAKVKTMVIDTTPANDASSESTTVGSADTDLDGVPDAQDCAPANGNVWSVPGEVTGLVFGLPSNKAAMQWLAPSTPGGTVVSYDLIRSTTATGFATPTCIATNVSAISASDPANPAGAFFYLVRSENACGGNLGNRSNGVPRSAGSCP